MGGLFLDAQDLAGGVEFDNRVAFRIVDIVSEIQRARLRPLRTVQQELTKTCAIENIVAEDEHDRITGNKILAEDEGLGDPIRRRLRRITDSQAPLAAAAEQALEKTYFVRPGDHQDF